MTTCKRVNTKTYVRVGRNENLKSKLSSKIYMLRISNRTLYRSFGPIDFISRQARVRGRLQEQMHVFASHAEARRALEALIASKRKRGYERMPRGFKVIYPKPKGGQ